MSEAMQLISQASRNHKAHLLRKSQDKDNALRLSHSDSDSSHATSLHQQQLLPSASDEQLTSSSSTEAVQQAAGVSSALKMLLEVEQLLHRVQVSDNSDSAVASREAQHNSDSAALREAQHNSDSAALREAQHNSDSAAALREAQQKLSQSIQVLHAVLQQHQQQDIHTAITGAMDDINR
jgi:hypothetical protein